ncbi:hypothetical protein V6N13_077216 [Hibiscus sabdariffa]
MEDSVSPSQGWSIIVDYVNHVTTLTAPAVTEFQNISHLYLKVLEPILQDLASGPHEHQKLYQLMSSLSNLEGDLDGLKKVRCAVWERIARFSEDLLLASYARVHVLELMQFTTDTSSRFTSTSVALRSSQLMAAISPGFEIAPDDLSTVDTAVSCFLKLCAVANADPHYDVSVAILEEWEGLFDERAFRKPNLWRPKRTGTHSRHILYTSAGQIFKGLIKASRVRDILELIDQSISKTGGVLLDEDDEGLQLESLAALENRLKQEGTSNIGSDHEFLMLVLSSGILSTVINKSSLGTVFSCACYLVGNLSRQFQQAQVPMLGKKGSNEHVNTEGDILFPFARISFPRFVSELVNAHQQILAGFVVTKAMHTNPSSRLINLAETSLGRDLERQLQVREHDKTAPYEPLKKTVSSLREKLGNSLQSALSLLPRNESNR